MKFRIVACMLWIGSLSTTMVLLSTITSEPGVILVGAVAIQAVLTTLESPVWSGRPNILPLIAVAIDTLINAGGLWTLMPSLAESPSGEFLSAMFPPITGGSAIWLTLLLAVILAYGPEAAWRMQ